MEALVAKLDSKLQQWDPQTADDVRERISEIINWADHDCLDLARSRTVEQEVFDLIDDES